MTSLPECSCLFWGAIIQKTGSEKSMPGSPFIKAKTPNPSTSLLGNYQSISQSSLSTSMSQLFIYIYIHINILYSPILPQTNIALENGWLEYYFPWGLFSGAMSAMFPICPILWITHPHPRQVAWHTSFK